MLFKRKAKENEEFAELMDTPVVDETTEAGSAVPGTDDASTGGADSAAATGDGTAGSDVNPFEQQEPVSDAFEMREADNGPHIPLWGWIVGGVIIVALIAGFVYAAFIMPAHDNTIKKEDSSAQSSLGSATENGKSGDSGNERQKIMDSLGLPSYYERKNTEITDKDRATADEEAKAGAPENGAAALISKEQNPDLTDDPKNATNKDGTINPNYSYLTYDNVIPVIRDDIERLVNPVYGGWEALQHNSITTDDGSWQSLSDMFSTNVSLRSKEDAQNATHLFADWNADDYGGQYYLSPDTPFMGVVNSYDCTYALQGNYEDHIDCTVNVDYTGDVLPKDYNAESSFDKTTVSKVMKIHYKVNYDELSTSSRRVLITSVEQN